MNAACVITTINPPTKTVEAMVDRFPHVIVIGDKKTPSDWQYSGVDYYSHECQSTMNFRLQVPDNHYARKNLGYLQAIKSGASLIYDIDDDNFPSDNWKMRQLHCEAMPITSEGWCNVYQLFLSLQGGSAYKGIIWPRGFALDHIDDDWVMAEPDRVVHSPIQQGLANGNTDVDAIWRFVTLSEYPSFDALKSVALTPRVWCPFNSQTTWWWPEAYHLMYLPVYSTFRMCDIWRSFVAQRCLWEIGFPLVFHSPAEVVQERNPHNLLSDFKDEVPGYVNNGEIVRVLGEAKLDGILPLTDMYHCYWELVRAGFLPEEELVSLRAWQSDIEILTSHR